MRVLLIHAERFSWRPREPASEVRDDPVEGAASNALVAFVTVESLDVPDEGYLAKVAEDIAAVADRVRAEAVVLYPYAHLSSDLARPYVAREVLNRLYSILQKSKFKILKAPFGYYKEFDVKCLGHPLAELSRSYRPEEAGRAAVQREAARDRYVLVTPDGAEHDPSSFDYGGDLELKALVEKEVMRRELGGGEEPRYLDYARRLGFQWEPMSDVGHMRYGPEATVMMELVEDYAYQVARSLGIPIFKIRGTNMFKIAERAIESHARLFGERLYMVESDTDLILRYAACFQQFAMAKDWVISYRNLPMGLLEIADSYRHEQPGETVLLFRLRRFYMPDLHIFARDLREAMEITFRLHEAIFREIGKLGRSYVSLYNVTEEFYREHRGYLAELARREGRPVLVRILPGQRYYWVLNVEYHIVDELGRPREIATFQIDVGNAERFGIRYVDEQNRQRHPVIIHTAILGSVERYIYAVLDTMARQEREGGTPRLPTWLAPVQVRIIPITADNLDYSMKVAEAIEAAGFRVDVDDRDETLARRIRDAERSWIPYICVVGAREVQSGVLSVRIRGEGQASMTVDELVARLREETRGYPTRPLYMPKRLSQRPSW